MECYSISKIDSKYRILLKTFFQNSFFCRKPSFFITYNFILFILLDRNPPTFKHPQSYKLEYKKYLTSLVSCLIILTKI